MYFEKIQLPMDLIVQFIFFLTLTIILKYLYDEVVKQPIKEKNYIRAPELLPFIGNIHLLYGPQLLSKFLQTLRKYASPVRIKFFSQNYILVDDPKDIEKLYDKIWIKSDLYDILPYNDGLITIAGIFNLPRK